MTKAMRSDTIKSIKFERAPYSEAVKDGVSAITLTCSIVIVKVGKWDQDALGYSYNDDLSYF